MHGSHWFPHHQLQTTSDQEHLADRSVCEGISLSLPAAAGSLKLCLCHQTPAWPKHIGEVRMGNMTASLPPPGVGKGSATLGETTSQYVWLKNLGLDEGIILNNFGSCRSRTQRRTQSYTSVHDQQKQANPLHRHIPPLSRGKTGCLCFVRGPSSHCTFPQGPLRQEWDTPTPAPCTAAHSSGARKHCKLESTQLRCGVQSREKVGD